MTLLRKLSLVLIVVVLLSGIAAAQDNMLPLSMGETVEGELTAQMRRAAYVFEGTAGITIIATLDSRHFDAYLLLLDEEGDVLAEDDDSGEGFGAQIIYPLLDDSMYTLIVTSQRAQRSGDRFYAAGYYTLVLDGLEEATPELVPEPDFPEITPEVTPELAPDFSPTPETPGDVMVPGDFVRGRVTTDLPSQSYTLRAGAGDVVMISLNADDFDNYLILLDGEGRVIQEDDDSGGGLNAQIGPLELPYSGDYTLMVSSFAFVTEGRAEAGSYRLQVDAVAAQTITFDMTFSGQLSDRQPQRVYRFQPEPGDIVIATLETGDFSVSMHLNAPGVKLSTFGGGATIGPVITQDGTGYIVTVSSADTFLPSVYSLRLERISPQMIDFDESVAVSFDDADHRYFLFEGMRGDVIDVRVESGGQFDSELSIIDADGVEIGYDDDSGTGLDPEINRFPLLEDGMYSLLVQPYIPGDNASVSLVLARHIPPSLDEGIQVVRISDKQPDAQVTFAGRAGTQVAVRARVLAGAEHEPRIVISQNDTHLAANTLGQVDGLILEFTVPATEPVTVSLHDAGGNPAIVEFSLVIVDDDASRG